MSVQYTKAQALHITNRTNPLLLAATVYRVYEYYQGKRHLTFYTVYRARVHHQESVSPFCHHSSLLRCHICHIFSTVHKTASNSASLFFLDNIGICYSNHLLYLLSGRCKYWWWKKCWIFLLQLPLPSIPILACLSFQVIGQGRGGSQGGWFYHAQDTVLSERRKKKGVNEKKFPLTFSLNLRLQKVTMWVHNIDIIYCGMVASGNWW